MRNWAFVLRVTWTHTYTNDKKNHTNTFSSCAYLSFNGCPYILQVIWWHEILRPFQVTLFSPLLCPGLFFPHCFCSIHGVLGLSDCVWSSFAVDTRTFLCYAQNRFFKWSSRSSAVKTEYMDLRRTTKRSTNDRLDLQQSTFHIVNIKCMSRVSELSIWLVYDNFSCVSLYQSNKFVRFFWIECNVWLIRTFNCLIPNAGLKEFCKLIRLTHLLHILHMNNKSIFLGGFLSKLYIQWVYSWANGLCNLIKFHWLISYNVQFSSFLPKNNK